MRTMLNSYVSPRQGGCLEYNNQEPRTTKCTRIDREQWRRVTVHAYYKCTFVHNVRINNVPKQCVRLLYTYNLNIEENEVGPDSRQVPKTLKRRREKTFLARESHGFERSN